jgi:AraC-like DNA-binding protein
MPPALEGGGGEVLPQVRAAALTNYVEVARFCGLDPDRMLRRARINPAILTDPDDPVAANVIGKLLEASAREGRCDAFGLLMAESRNMASVGAVGLLLKFQGTARDVIEAIIRYQALMGDALLLAMDDDCGTTTIRLDVETEVGGHQGIDLLMGFTCRTISEVVSGRWHPESAHFVHAEPDDMTIHRRVFQCPLVFDSDFNGLACPSAWLDAPNPAAQSVMAEHAQRYLDMLIPKPADGSVTERARRSIYLLLPAGRATLDQVADNLALHPRTLQRLLDQEKRTFATLLGDARRELALRYLSNSTHSVAAIAQMTGYSSPSAFTRWFAGEFGVAPAAWRAEGRGEQGRTP